MFRVIFRRPGQSAVVARGSRRYRITAKKFIIYCYREKKRRVVRLRERGGGASVYFFVLRPVIIAHDAYSSSLSIRARFDVARRSL